MSGLLKDKRLHKVLSANILSSTGSGITMIAIPWLLVTGEAGEEGFGYVTLGVAILMFFLAPYVGLLIDKFSRKKMLLISQATGACISGIFALLGFFGLPYETWHLIILFTSGSLYYTVLYPTMFALNQEIFAARDYKALNGVMEVQSQTSSMLAGGIASLLLTKLDLSWILLIDGLSYLGAFLFMLTVPYKKSFRPEESESFWHRITEGYRYMKRYPLLFLFFVASFMPFICVMVTNYLFPVYVANFLKADVMVLGIAESGYAVGAIIAGTAIPFMMRKLDGFLVVAATVGLFAFSMTTIYFFPAVIVFLIMQVFLGIGNSGTRVARNSIIMETIPNDKIGRVNSLFRSIGLAFRITLIGLFTKTVSLTGADFSIGILSLIMGITVAAILYSFKASQSSLQKMHHDNDSLLKL